MPDHLELFPQQMREWARHQPHFAHLTQHGRQTLGDALDSLDGTVTEVLYGGWGGVSVKARLADGTFAVVKVPAELPERTALGEWRGLEVLHRSGISPEPLDVGDGWLALRWVDGQPLATKRQHPQHLDIAQLVFLATQLARIPTTGFVRRDHILTLRVTVQQRQHLHLTDIGVNPEEINDRNTRVCEELITLGPQTFNHGDFDPGNILTTTSGYTLIDPQPRVGPLEAELGWLTGSAAAGTATPDVTELRRTLCDATGCDTERVEMWERLYAASWLCEIKANTPHLTKETEALTRIVSAPQKMNPCQNP